jgi:O-antigen ligase
MFIGRGVTIPPIARKVTGTVILATLLLSITAGSIWFVSSKPSFRDWSSQAYHDLRYGAPSNEGTGRLLEMGSSGRWTLWEESIKSWEEHPYLGSGGQSFALIHLLQRDDGLIFVKQPHSHPFQLLAEFGLVGFLLGMAFISTALTFCTLTLCRQHDRWERSLAAAILSMLIIYLIHASFDWDWNMFAITAIYFFFTGIMLGWPGDVNRRSTEATSID